MSKIASLTWLAVLGLAGHASADDRFYTFDYQNLSTNQTQVLFVDLHTGAMPYSFSNGAHWGISIRGDSHDQQLPLGRGIAIGSFSQSHAGSCTGVMVEDFTQNWDTADGLIAGTCVSLTIQPYAKYLVELHASESNVYWSLHIWGIWTEQWSFVADGGCHETAQVNCWRNSADGSNASAFIASVEAGSNDDWVYENLDITHYNNP